MLCMWAACLVHVRFVADGDNLYANSVGVSGALYMVIFKQAQRSESRIPALGMKVIGSS